MFSVAARTSEVAETLSVPLQKHSPGGSTIDVPLRTAIGREHNVSARDTSFHFSVVYFNGFMRR